MTEQALTLDIRQDYLAMIRRNRLYNGLLLALFISLMCAGFYCADARNAGSFQDGWANIADFPAIVIGEAVEKARELPGHLLRFLPSLIETVNIAAASTLIGVIFAIALSLMATRGFARWPGLIPFFRRMLDIMRAMPEIVIALILIFVMGGGPVPAMIAITLHTVGALGKQFSEVNENASTKPVEGLAVSWSKLEPAHVAGSCASSRAQLSQLRLEINIRASAILGFVGAGGIGYELNNAMTWGQGKFDESAAIFILLFLTIIFFDQLSSHFREFMKQGKKT